MGICQKCYRTDGLHRHHIVARMDGGSDDESNLATLCSACHQEWHAAEEVTYLTFEDWLPAPPGWWVAMATRGGRLPETATTWKTVRDFERGTAEARLREENGRQH